MGIFAEELRRPFEVDERCFDCVELCHGCHARAENPDSRCADYFPLPDVGVNGATGQEIPPSRMGGRKEPRVRLPNGRSRQAEAQTEKPARQTEPEPVEQDPVQSGRRQSPAGTPGPGGKRLCGCGAVLEKRERCCFVCRLQRRKDAICRYRGRTDSSAAVQTV